MPALPNERGWKDTFIMYPGEVTTVIARWAPTDAPAAAAPSTLWFPFNPNGGHGYVWHCHIIDHEDNEMMRPYLVAANASAGGGRIDSPLYAGYQMVHPDAPVFAASFALAPGEEQAEETTSGNGLPKSITLSQNYPNPFNPSTEIRFTLPQATHVKLTVYNVAGQVVATLIDADAPAGFHAVRLDASTLASGVYFYKMTTGNFTQTKKMTLLK
jgi:hypothetical protein